MWAAMLDHVDIVVQTFGCKFPFKNKMSSNWHTQSHLAQARVSEYNMTWYISRILESAHKCEVKDTLNGWRI